MCRLACVSAHLETFHRLTWICCDQNPRVSTSSGVRELSAGITPSPVLGWVLLVLNTWGFMGGVGTLSQHRWACVRVSWSFQAARFYVQVPQNVSNLLLGGLGDPHHGREQFASLFFIFHLMLCAKEISPWLHSQQWCGTCCGKPQSLWGGQDLSHAGHL